MKLYLNSNLAEGTPEELVTYKELLKERGLDYEKLLFHSGHAHQPTEEEVQDTFKGFFGSLKLDKSSIGSEESSTEEDEEADVGEFYTVNVENSALPSGTLLKKVDKDTHKDSTGQEYLCVDSNALSHIDKNLYQLEDRFNFATKVGIRLTDTTDLAQATEGEYFIVTEGYSDLSVGDIVTIVRDDRDSMPQCKDKYSNFYYLELHHLEPVEDNLESTESSTDEAQTPSRDLKVGDRVKVLNSLGGAVGEATVTAVLEGGRVELAGNNKEGSYLSNWSNYISNVEKIEKPASFGAIQAKAYLEDKSIDQVVEEEQSKHKQESDNESVEEEIYDYYEVVDPGLFASSVEKGTVFKVIGNTYTLLNQEGKDRDYINVVTSTGLTQTSPLRDSVIKPIIDNSFIAGRFKFAKEVGINLKVDTDFEEECQGHHFKVTEDEYLSTFNPTDTLTVRRDDNTNAIAFQDLNGKAQYTILKHVKEIARPSK